MSINDIFIVHPGDTTIAGCDKFTDQLNFGFKESLILVNAALTALDTYANDVVMRELLTAYFGIKFEDPNFPADIKTVRSTC